MFRIDSDSIWTATRVLNSEYAIHVLFLGLCRQFVSDVGGTKSHVGIWSQKVEAGPLTVTADTKCDIDYAGTDCEKNNSKCKTNKAFSIIGILATVGALVFLAAGIGPAILPPVVAVLAGFSYLIVWAIIAGFKNDDDCGYGKNDDVSLGGAFGCLVVAWLLCWAAAAAAFMGGKPEG
jgi:hypothetical protein